MSMSATAAHISVCICTYKRPQLLKRSLIELRGQETESRFSYSVVVADNDSQESARGVVSWFAEASGIETAYCIEPVQNIALARNKAVQCATGDYVAFIDDDEFPAKDWLLTMFGVCQQDKAVDGVLGPVKPSFDHEPPEWLRRGRFCERPEHNTGSELGWRETRTGNVMFRRQILQSLQEPFRREFGNGGEDQDFFKRMMEKGYRFIWCNEAVVYEVVPVERWTRSYMLKRALLRGQNEQHLLTIRSVAKSTIAVLGYALLLPFTFFFGQHAFMRYAVRLLDHVGKLLAAIGVRPMGRKYLGT
jgi:succinoglycan biosynthesis protein ExoM